MGCCEGGRKNCFLEGARVFFGLWLLYVGLVKWLPQLGGPGVSGFVGWIHSEFDKTWSPVILNEILAWVILIAEPLLALWILSGKHARKAWTATACLMFMLTMGMTLLQKPEVIANWQYLVFALVCASMSPDEKAAV